MAISLSLLTNLSNQPVNSAWKFMLITDVIMKNKNPLDPEIKFFITKNENPLNLDINFFIILNKGIERVILFE